MKLIIGLGNPGKEYEKARHNAGWMVADALQKALGFEEFKNDKKFKAQVSIGTYDEEKVILAKPMTMMNLSGEAVQALVAFYKLDSEDTLVIYDDLDTPFGSLRIRKKGGSGTHNGMKSVVQTLGENFPRIRIGIESRGITSAAEHETASYVLSPFNKTEQKTLKEAINTAVGAVKTILKQGLEPAMNNYNSA